ncbi:unnamed protein product [Scytosiphon promiscuus]
MPFMESLAELCRVLKGAGAEVTGGVQVTQLVCGVVSALAKTLGAGFCVPAAAIIPDLLPFLSTPLEAVQEAIAGSVEHMLAECHSPSVLRAATVSLAGSRKAHLRRRGSTFLCVAIQRWPRETLRITLSPIMGQVRNALLDADATVRREGRHTFGVFVQMWPAEGGGMYHALDRAHQRAVLQDQPQVSNFVNGGGGGGGQRPPGMTQARYRSLVARRKEKDRKLKDQQRLAAAGHPHRDDRRYSSRSGRRRSGCRRGYCHHQFRVPPPSACSDGLRRAARVALRKSDLLSPTMRRLLQDPSRLCAASAARDRGEGSGASAAEADVSSPGSEESGLDTEEMSANMTPAELRGSMSGMSPFSSARSEGARSSRAGPEETAAPSACAPTAVAEATGVDQAPRRPKLDDLDCPSPRGSAPPFRSPACTPTRGILSDGLGKGNGSTPSTVKRRVRFEMEKQMREAESLSAGAHLNSPCRSSASSSAGGGWRGDDDGVDGEHETARDEERGYAPGGRGRARAVVAALAVAVSVAVVAVLGGGDGGVGSLRRGSVAKRAGGSSETPRYSPACFSPAAVPWLPQHQLEVCTAVEASDSTGGVLRAAAEGGGVTPDEQPASKEAEAAFANGDVVVRDAGGAQERAAVTAVGSGAEEADGGRYQPSTRHHPERLTHGKARGQGAAGQAGAAVPASAVVSTDAGSYATKAIEGSDAHAHRRKASVAAPLSSPPMVRTEGGSYATKATKGSASPPVSLRSSRPPSPATLWGWVEAGAAVLGAAVLLTTVFWKARGQAADEWVDDDCGGGSGESDAPSTPNGGGVSGGAELGRYETVELIKKGDTPATLRSVKRSRRIGSAQKANSSTSGTFVMDLGVSALDFANA